MSLNIALLRKVQASIADETQPFSMNNWCYCIAGHTYRVVTGRAPTYPEIAGILPLLPELLEITESDGRGLFRTYLSADAHNRAAAIAKIDSLIERESATVGVAIGVAEPAPLVASAPGQIQEEELELVGAQ